mmetsp:Transcript_23970/g.77880  ORF Transcript_23970/g.77880 Transcript_23970/m.77880 type:complete len:340 (-) Transcript_23970:2325-3344(-)
MRKHLSLTDELCIRSVRVRRRRGRVVERARRPRGRLPRRLLRWLGRDALHERVLPFEPDPAVPVPRAIVRSAFRRLALLVEPEPLELVRELVAHGDVPRLPRPRLRNLVAHRDRGAGVRLPLRAVPQLTLPRGGVDGGVLEMRVGGACARPDFDAEVVRSLADKVRFDIGWNKRLVLDGGGRRLFVGESGADAARGEVGVMDLRLRRLGHGSREAEPPRGVRRACPRERLLELPVQVGGPLPFAEELLSDRPERVVRLVRCRLRLLRCSPRLLCLFKSLLEPLLERLALLPFHLRLRLRERNRLAPELVRPFQRALRAVQALRPRRLHRREVLLDRRLN